MTRRPMPLYAASLAGGIILIYALGYAPGMAEGPDIGRMAAASLCACVLMFLAVPRPRGSGQQGNDERAERTRAVSFFCVAFFAAGSVLMMYAVSVELPEPAAEAKITGVVTDVEYKDEDDLSVTVKTDAGRVLVRCYSGKFADPMEAAGLAGKHVEARGSLALADSRRNPGCFDYRLYLRGKKILAVMTAADIEAGAVESSLINRLSLFRERVVLSAEKYMSSDGAALFAGMMFGDKSGLDDDVYEQFRRNGTAHILAVSGLHVGMIYALLCAVIGSERKKRTNIIILCVLAMYAVMAGRQASVVRAVIMIALHVIARSTHRRYDMLSAASFTAIVMMIYEPYALFETGFQMSFLAVATISFLFPLFKDMRPRGTAGRIAKEVLLPTALIQAGTAPYSLYVFNYFSLGSFIANIPVVFLAGIIVPAGIVCMAFSAVVPPSFAGAEAFAYKAADITCLMMEKCNGIFYADGASSLDAASPPLVLILIYYAALFGVSSEAFRVAVSRKEKGKIGKSLLISLLCILALGSVFRNDFLSSECVFVDVGQGACVHFRTPSGKDILFDGGGRPSFGNEEAYDVGEKILKPYLLKNGASKVDLAVVTHLDADHYKGIVSICRDGMVGKLAVHECLKDEKDRIISDTGLDPDDILFFRTGDVVSEGGFRLEILGPTGEGSSENGNSLVASASFDDVSFLITGDIDETAEGTLAAAYRGTGKLDADVMQVPHHGSKSSSSDVFIAEAAPAIAVVQAGKNNMYGHPAPETLERLADHDAQILRNDEQGAVGFDVDKGQIREIHTMLRLENIQ